MKKGLFWVVGEGDGRKMLTYAVLCDENGQRLCKTPTYNSKKGNSFSHQCSWAEAAKDSPSRIRSKPWDYYPRGRVEIKDGKATAYFNPILGDWKDFDASLILFFDLTNFPVVMVPDYSTHYKHRQEQDL